ncbi:MAG: TetR/AcrR family transcriptional regulator [Clostridiales bacterium]|nr:TetR/AcrR family transcriptional regulator [Clostridiales bacterium]MBD5118318.1 TetR/AcrR family transcriptional regulator [Clostridiales bacterium]
MPPKFKFTREQIIRAALDITREEGFSAVTARAVGAKLHSSSKVIFSLFQNMEELQAELKKAAEAVYAEYIKRALEEELAFKGVGTQYILFAIKEPKLFQLLFMSEQEQKPSVANVLPMIDSSYEDILRSVQNGYGLSRSMAEQLYRHLWIYTHGIAVLCATNMCVFTPDEISRMITQVFKGTLKEITGGIAQ